MIPYKSGSLSVSGPAASVSPRNLFIVQIPWPHVRTTEPKLWGKISLICVLTDYTHTCACTRICTCTHTEVEKTYFESIHCSIKKCQVSNCTSIWLWESRKVSWSDQNHLKTSREHAIIATHTSS